MNFRLYISPVQNVRKQEMKNLPETRAFEYARELFEQVRARQQIVSCNLERFFSEVAGRFNQRPEERLYNVVHTLLQRCYRLPLHKSSTVPEDMKRELKNVCDACMTHELHVATRRRGMPAEMREKFVRDVQPSPTTTIQLLMTSLKVRPIFFPWRSPHAGASTLACSCANMVASAQEADQPLEPP